MNTYKDSNPNLGIYDMRRDVTGLPRSLANSINNHICNGGGGGGGQTTISGIDPEFKPDLTKALGIATDRYTDQVEKGPDSIVAGMTDDQITALGLQRDLGQQAVSGTGIYDTKAAQEGDLKNLMGTSMSSAAGAGALGSARSQKAMQSALAGRSLEFAQQRQKDAAQGSSMIGDVGTTLQKYQQQRMDAPDTAANRYFGYLTGNAGKQTTTTGGGK